MRQFGGRRLTLAAGRRRIIVLGWNDKTLKKTAMVSSYGFVSIQLPFAGSWLCGTC
jgi:hypothetical protein